MPVSPAGLAGELADLDALVSAPDIVTVSEARRLVASASASKRLVPCRDSHHSATALRVHCSAANSLDGTRERTPKLDQIVWLLAVPVLGRTATPGTTDPNVLAWAARDGASCWT
jgi:hypothetical protein